jgi:hypothetical protein
MYTIKLTTSHASHPLPVSLFLNKEDPPSCIFLIVQQVLTLSCRWQPPYATNSVFHKGICMHLYQFSSIHVTYLLSGFKTDPNSVAPSSTGYDEPAGTTTGTTPSTPINSRRTCFIVGRLLIALA